MRLRFFVASILSAGLFAAGTAAAGPVTAQPASLTFPDTGTGAMSAEQMVTLTNTSNSGVVVQSINIGGANPGDFVLDNMFPPPFTLAGGASISYGVSFKPILGGLRTATVTATLGNGLGNVDVPVSGKGLGPKIQVTPSPINAGGTKINVTTMTTITVANAGGGTVNVKSIALSGPQANEFSLNGTPNLPTALAPNTNFMMTLNFTPLTQGTHTATLTVTSDDPNTPTLNVAVKGLAGDPAISADVGTVAFGNIRVGLTSPIQPVTISNNGFSDLHISALTVDGTNAGDFILDKGTLPGIIAVGQSVKINVSFKPTAIGGRQGRVVISSDDPNAPNKFIGLLGNGTISMLALSTPNLDFGTQRIYTASANQTIIIKNTGSDAANIVSAMFMGAQSSWFRISPSVMLPLKVPAGGQASIDVAAVPLGLGAGTAVLGLMSDDPNTPSFSIPVKVSGVGSMVQVDPGFADFGLVGVLGKKSITVTVTNGGTDVLNVTSFALLDPMNNMAFSVASPPMTPVMIAPGKNLMFTVDFTPMVEGAEMAEIDLMTDDPMARNIHIPLDGIGATAMLSVTPTNLNFNMLPVGTQSLAQNVTITNNGGAPLSIKSVTMTGATNQFHFDDPGAFMLSGGTSRTVQVVYAPVSAGGHMATLVVTPDGFMPAQVKLSGTAVSPMLQVAIGGGASVLDFGDVTVGSVSDPLQVALRNNGTVPVTIGSIVSSDPTFVIDTSKTMLTLPPTMTGGPQTTFSVLFAPATADTKTANITLTLKGQTMAIATVMAKGNGVAPTKRGTGSGGGGCALGGQGRGHEAATMLLFLFALLPVALVIRRRRRA